MSRMVALGDIADLNPRESSTLPPDTEVSFVPLAQLDIASASAGPGTTRPFHEVQKGYTIFRDRDLLVAKITPSFENGKIGQAILNNGFGVGSTEFHVIRPDRNKVSDRYLLHFLRQSWVRFEGERRMTGSGGQKRVPAGYLASLRLPLPQLDDQLHIAAILDLAEAMRTGRRQTINLLASLPMSVFHESFGDPLANPKELDVVRLGELGEWRSGGTPPRSQPEFFEGDTPWFSSGELGPLFVSESREHVSDAALQATSVKSVPPGALMVGMYDTAALKSSIATVASSCNQAIAFGELDRALADPLYVYFALQIAKERLKARRRGIRQKNLNLSIVREIQIALAPMDDQLAFAGRVQAIEAQRTAAQRSLDSFDELFASLQARAFSGQL